MSPCRSVQTTPTECCRGSHSVAALGEKRETDGGGTEPRRDMTMTKSDRIPRRSTDRPRTDPPIVASGWLPTVAAILPWHPSGHKRKLKRQPRPHSVECQYFLLSQPTCTRTGYRKGALAYFDGVASSTSVRRHVLSKKLRIVLYITEGSQKLNVHRPPDEGRIVL